MAAGLGSAGAELAHHTAQAIGPVAGAKGLAFKGQALNENFFGAAGDHR